MNDNSYKSAIKLPQNDHLNKLADYLKMFNEHKKI